MGEHPIAGPVENAISADVSAKVLALLGEHATASGTLIGCAAVLTGAMDGLARFACTRQLTEASADEVSATIANGVAYFVAHHHQIPHGEA